MWFLLTDFRGPAPSAWHTGVQCMFIHWTSGECQLTKSTQCAASESKGGMAGPLQSNAKSIALSPHRMGDRQVSPGQLTAVKEVPIPLRYRYQCAAHTFHNTCVTRVLS